MIGSSIAGLLSVTFNITANAIGIGGLPGILSIQAKYMIPFAGVMLVAILVLMLDRKSTRLNSSHLVISYAVFCLKKKI